MQEIFLKHDGNIPVIVYIKINGSAKRFIIDYKIKLSDEFVSELQKLLGDESIAYQTM
jgi:hypothetical protein